MMITNNQLKQIYPFSTESNRQKYLPYLNEFMSLYNIHTKDRIAAFLAQIGHESGQLFYNEEIASGKAYEGRRDLGNTEKGDGVRFKGRGLIQITGRANYQKLTNEMRGLPMGIDFVEEPDLLKKPEYATKSACWWWHNRGLNELADENTEVNFKRITRIINGGYNGYEDRYKIWQRAKQILSI
ncbi:glycoside hydrolase family 19 protein [Dysgonomonas sp. HDW5B]|uniref:glycoside hydrolase family 19 protein n=1 Tax=Dysgonomonas sp. HDW5B TaxID=2714927 RepID=UPI001408A348|nr:glycoside hydrolase family 19 protein [Dysgonomonas sp. HDW5B]QIK55024.1 glycoside hydrolase family 19 protein [Dysgonomonas sp. HDW5B]